MKLFCILPVILICIHHAIASRPPELISNNIKRRQFARVGSSHRFSCPVRSNPPAFLSWSKDNEPISPGWTRFKILSSGLRIRDLDKSDAGMYSCVAVNGFGSVRINYTLQVLDRPNGEAPSPGTDPPFIETRDVKLKVVEKGDLIKLRCRARGKPKPEIRWYKNNVKLNLPTNNKNQKSRTSILKIRSASLQDSGSYMCSAVNIYGTDNFTIKVDVQEPDGPKPEMHVPESKNRTVAYGESTSFMCQVKSKLMAPKIKWLREFDPKDRHLYNGTFVFGGKNFAVLPTGEAKVIESGVYMNELKIDKATSKDAGLYACMGVNINGYNYQPVFLTVQSQPPDYREVTTRPPRTGIDDTTMILIIAVPSAAVFLLVVIIVYFLHRKHKCNTYRNTPKQRQSPYGAPHPQVTTTSRGGHFMPVPTRPTPTTFANGYPTNHQFYPPSECYAERTPYNSSYSGPSPYNQQQMHYEFAS